MPLRFIIITSLCLTIPFHATAEIEEPAIEYITGKVQEVSEQYNGMEYPLQEAQIYLLSGPDAGSTVTVENRLVGKRGDLRMTAGQKVVLQRIQRDSGKPVYHFQEAHRLFPLLFLFCIFLLLVLLIGKRRGLMSMLGLTVSIFIIIFVIFPLIIAGYNAFIVSSVSIFLIACSTILISHGLKKRTFLALLTTCITLIFTILFAVLSVTFTRTFGLGSEEGIFLQLDPSINIDPRGVLLAGIVIGALGILDDITTAQLAAIEEISKANPSYNFKRLYRAGVSVGSEHIASMINTLALAYVGASLPLLLLFFIDSSIPAWVTMNSAFLVEEIVRTLVGSSSLLLAVPISTLCAAYAFGSANKKT